MIQSNDTNILIDAGPDIKYQLINHNLNGLNAIIITHEHADHISGLDELRPFYFSKQEKINVYTIERTRIFYLVDLIIFLKKMINLNLILNHQ